MIITAEYLRKLGACNTDSFRAAYPEGVEFPTSRKEVLTIFNQLRCGESAIPLFKDSKFPEDYIMLHVPWFVARIRTIYSPDKRGISDEQLDILLDVHREYVKEMEEYWKKYCMKVHSIFDALLEKENTLAS